VVGGRLLWLFGCLITPPFNCDGLPLGESTRTLAAIRGKGVRVTRSQSGKRHRLRDAGRRRKTHALFR
jgi:hypothetical protein